METLALILAGGRGSRLDILSEKRSKPAVPFAGKFRIIDFALSNCCNSGIFQIGILTQYLPLSLNSHRSFIRFRFLWFFYKFINFKIGISF